MNPNKPTPSPLTAMLLIIVILILAVLLSPGQAHHPGYRFSQPACDDNPHTPTPPCYSIPVVPFVINSATEGQ